MLQSRVTGLLVNEHHSEPYAEYAAKHDLKLLVFTPEGICWEKRTATGLYLTRYGVYFKRLPLPKVIYNRLYPHDQRLVDRLLSLSPLIQVFNQVTQFDKWEIHKMLAATELAAYLPQTYEFDQATLHQALSRHGDIIIKPRLGRQGSGLWRLTALPGDLLLVKPAMPVPVALPYSDAVLNLFHVLMVPYTMVIQEYIDLAAANGCHFDMRALVQKDGCGRWQVTALTSRVAEPQQYITNDYQKVAHSEKLLVEHGFPADAIVGEARTVSVKAAALLEAELGHLAEISVDLALGRGKLWIIEVNSKPDKQLYTELKDEQLLEDVYLMPLKYGLYLRKKRRPRRGVLRPIT